MGGRSEFQVDSISNIKPMYLSKHSPRRGERSIAKIATIQFPPPEGWHIRSKGGLEVFPAAAGGVWGHNATAAFQVSGWLPF
jgi:hypothetical protein